MRGAIIIGGRERHVCMCVRTYIYIPAGKYTGEARTRFSNSALQRTTRELHAGDPLCFC